jgi:hypothetical protein
MGTKIEKKRKREVRVGPKTENYWRWISFERIEQ